MRLATFVVLGVLFSAAESTAPATLILVGGTIYTANPTQPKAEALAIAGERILRVGTRQDVEALRGSSTRVVDLAGATVVPGLEDAHGHVASLGTGLSQLDLTDTPDVAHIASLVAARAPRTSGDHWIEGFGWDQNRWPVKTWPTAGDLDAVSGNHPVALQRVDGHATWVNSRAMSLAGINEDDAGSAWRPPDRDAAGAPTGRARGRSASAGRARRPADPRQRSSRSRDSCRGPGIVALGLTMVHDAGASSATIAAYLAARRRPADCNTRLLRDDQQFDPATTREWFARGPLVDPSQRLTVRAVKMYADGALGSRGAALLEPTTATSPEPRPARHARRIAWTR